jgi:tRNA (cytidine56-2'-O)-methyltransferase
LREGVQEVNEAWGGRFEVVEAHSWRSVFKEAREEGRLVVHLTMYGIPIQDRVGELASRNRFLIAVGGPKVPGEVYRLADYNVSVTSQPHSEVAALAIAMHEIQEGEELKKEFGPSKMKIVPSEKGKKVEKG